MLCERSAADVNGAWTTIAELPSSGAYQTAMVTLNEKVYVMGGNPSASRKKVLMHDGGDSQRDSLAALKRILPKLKSMGYKFKVMPNC